MNYDLLVGTWKQIDRDQMARLFYAALFDLAPVEDLFPRDQRDQRKKLLATLGRIVQGASRATDDDMLRRLGRSHRRYGAEAAHYPVVGQALLVALSWCAPEWTPEHEAAWSNAYGLMAAPMAAAAEELERAGVPAWIEADIVRSEETDGGQIIELLPAQPAPGYSWTEGTGVWLSLRPAGWVRASVLAQVGDHASDGAVIHLPVDDANFDAWELAFAPPGSQVRLSPNYEEM